jgi:PKD repeat protein
VLSVGEHCRFSATATFDETPRTGVVTWRWDFGDKTECPASASVNHAYGTPGEYLVSVTASADKQTVSLDLSVIVVTSDPERLLLECPMELVFGPNVDSETADLASVDCRIAESWLQTHYMEYLGAKFYKKVNGQWIRQDDAGTGWVTPGSYPEGWKTARVQWETAFERNSLVEWKAEYGLLPVEPEAPEETYVIYGGDHPAQHRCRFQLAASHQTSPR